MDRIENIEKQLNNIIKDKKLVILEGSINEDVFDKLIKNIPNQKLGIDDALIESNDNSLNISGNFGDCWALNSIPVLNLKILKMLITINNNELELNFKGIVKFNNVETKVYIEFDPINELFKMSIKDNLTCDLDELLTLTHGADLLALIKPFYLYTTLVITSIEYTFNPLNSKTIHLCINTVENTDWDIIPLKLSLKDIQTYFYITYTTYQDSQKQEQTEVSLSSKIVGNTTISGKNVNFSIDIPNSDVWELIIESQMDSDKLTVDDLALFEGGESTQKILNDGLSLLIIEDVSLTEIKIGINVTNKNIAYLAISNQLKLSGIEMQTVISLPHFSLDGRMIPGEKLNLKQLLSKYNLNTDGIKELEVSILSINATPIDKKFSLFVGMEDDWELDFKLFKPKLQSINAGINYDSGTFSGSIGANVDLFGSDLLLTAIYDNNEWIFKGGLSGISNLSITKIANEMFTDLDVSLPSSFPEVKITNFEVSLNLNNREFSLMGTITNDWSINLGPTSFAVPNAIINLLYNSEQSSGSIQSIAKIGDTESNLTLSFKGEQVITITMKPVEENRNISIKDVIDKFLPNKLLMPDEILLLNFKELDFEIGSNYYKIIFIGNSELDNIFFSLSATKTNSGWNYTIKADIEDNNTPAFIKNIIGDSLDCLGLSFTEFEYSTQEGFKFKGCVNLKENLILDSLKTLLGIETLGFMLTYDPKTKIAVLDLDYKQKISIIDKYLSMDIIGVSITVDNSQLSIDIDATAIIVDESQDIKISNRADGFDINILHCEKLANLIPFAEKLNLKDTYVTIGYTAGVMTKFEINGQIILKDSVIPVSIYVDKGHIEQSKFNIRLDKGASINTLVDIFAGDTLPGIIKNILNIAILTDETILNYTKKDKEELLGYLKSNNTKGVFDKSNNHTYFTGPAALEISHVEEGDYYIVLDHINYFQTAFYSDKITDAITIAIPSQIFVDFTSKALHYKASLFKQICILKASQTLTTASFSAKVNGNEFIKLDAKYGANTEIIGEISEIGLDDFLSIAMGNNCPGPIASIAKNGKITNGRFIENFEGVAFISSTISGNVNIYGSNASIYGDVNPSKPKLMLSFIIKESINREKSFGYSKTFRIPPYFGKKVKVGAEARAKFSASFSGNIVLNLSQNPTFHLKIGKPTVSQDIDIDTSPGWVPGWVKHSIKSMVKDTANTFIDNLVSKVGNEKDIELSPDQVKMFINGNITGIIESVFGI